MDAFYLDGWRYVEQWRRCGKEDCRCNEGELHGPYWYKRHKQAGQVYIGRELPPAIAEVVRMRTIYAETIQAHIAQLVADQHLLQALLDGKRVLSLQERHRLEQLGYAWFNEAGTT